MPQWISGDEAQDLIVPLRELAQDTAIWQQRSDALEVFPLATWLDRFG